MNYIGYFKGLLEDITYTVSITKDANVSPKEITMAGDEPFIVSYNNSTTLFDGVRTSIATIKIVNNTYLEDVLPSTARETRVTLTSTNHETNTIKIEWEGYLTPKVYNQGYTEENEIIELESADCLSSTQYVPYESSTAIGIKSFKDIIVDIFRYTNINKIYWPTTRYIDNKIAYADDLFISEQNFFSSDTDEPWDSYEVLEEMCKYLGFTVLQHQDNIYFMDYTYLKENDSMVFAIYERSKYFERSGYNVFVGDNNIITEKDILGSGQNVSFEPIYNKFVVKDSFYTSEDFITNIFDDTALKNRGGDFYSSFQLDVPPPRDPSNPNSYKLPNSPTYPKGTSWFQQKYVNDADDTKYVYWHRLYDHEDFESVYRDYNLNEVKPHEDLLNNPNTTRNYIGGTICDLGRVRKEYFNNDTYQTIVTNQVDWERYLLIHQHRTGPGWSGWNPNASLGDDMIIFRLKPGSRGKCILREDSYLIINYKLLFTKYRYRNYINPDWTQSIGKKSGWESGAIGETGGNLSFKLGIGGKYWNGTKWIDKPTTFKIMCTREEDEYAYFMEEKEVLNNVSWELEIDEEGYKIPLEGIDTAGEIDFAIYLPNLQLLTDFDGLHDFNYNNYCWVKDFSIKTANAGQDKEVEETDVVYENVVNELNVSEMSDIELKITTGVANQKPSYSNVIYFDTALNKNTLLTTMKDSVLNQDMTPEENIITRYHKQYSTQTKKLTYTLPINMTPIEVYTGIDFENKSARYVQLGSELDYRMSRQIIDLIELK